MEKAFEAQLSILNGEGACFDQVVKDRQGPMQGNN